MSVALLNALLTRRSLKPKHLTAPAPTREELTLAARAALRAPVHGDVFPCRFVLVPEDKRSRLADLFRAASAAQGADAEKQDRAASKAHKGPQIVAFVVNTAGESDAATRESLISAGAALEQFLLALKAQGFAAITLSGSVLKDENLQAAFCKDPTEKLVAWITIGTPAEGVAFEPEAGTAPLSVWD